MYTLQHCGEILFYSLVVSGTICEGGSRLSNGRVQFFQISPTMEIAFTLCMRFKPFHLETLDVTHFANDRYPNNRGFCTLPFVAEVFFVQNCCLLAIFDYATMFSSIVMCRRQASFSPEWGNTDAVHQFLLNDCPSLLPSSVTNTEY